MVDVLNLNGFKFMKKINWIFCLEKQFNILFNEYLFKCLKIMKKDG